MKKVWNRMFPKYEPTEMESKVIEIIRNLMEMKSTSNILYCDYDAYISNDEIECYVVIEGRRISILNGKEYCVIDAEDGFLLHLKKIIGEIIDEKSEKVNGKIERTRMDILDGICSGNGKKRK